MSDSNVSSDVEEELNFIEGQAMQNNWAWKAHLFRCVNQDEARIEVTMLSMSSGLGHEVLAKKV